MLMKASAANRHIILFSDAQDSGTRRLQTPHDLSKAGISIRVIGLGTPSDVDAKLLEDIAKRGEGNIYFTDRPKEIPRIFAQDTFAVARNTFIKEPAALELAGALDTLAPPPRGNRHRSAATISPTCAMPPVWAYSRVMNTARRSWPFGKRATGVWPVTPAKPMALCRRLCTMAASWDFYATLSGWAAGQQSQLPDRMLLTQDIREGICYTLHLIPLDRAKCLPRPAPQAPARNLRPTSPQRDPHA